MLRYLLLLPLLLAPVACDALDEALGVEAPSRIPAENLESPESARLLVNGAIADFDCAFGSYIVLSGVVTDEFIDATQTANRWPYDRRDIRTDDARYATFGCEDLGVYSPLSTARWSADNVLGMLENWTDEQVENRTDLIATAAAYSGYGHLLLGEGFCSAAIDQGPELSKAQLFELAVGKFTRAIEAARAAGNEEILNMALVGRARALLDLGRTQEAAEDARLVTEGFVKNATASSAAPRRQNRVYIQNNRGHLVSVGPEYREVTFEGVPDPRVDVVYTGDVATDGTPIYVQTKYESDASPLPIATWDEAQLIIAEAELEAGNVQDAVAIINAFHERADLPRFESDDPAEVMQHIIEERERELFLESHHLYDVVRYDLELTPAAGTDYPKGGVYGTDTCFPLPDVERLNNPNI